MRQAAFLILFILLTGTAAAEVGIVTTGAPTTDIEPLLSVVAQGQDLIITPAADAEEAYIFLDGALLETLNDLEADEPVTITTEEVGEHQVETRTLRTYEYEWENFDIIKNDFPIELKYAEYEKDDKKIKFSLAHPGIIHPDHISRTVDSSAEEYREFTASVNEGTSVNCYPRITTGQNLFFSCYMSTYVRQLSLEAELGVKEITTVTFGADEEEVEEVVEDEVLVIPPPPPPPPVGTEQEVIDMPDADVLEEQIEMTDMFSDRAAPIPVTVFVILLFLSFMTILFIAAHHNYESKQAGTHHPLKKKK